ncbi:type IV secretion system protein [Rhizobium mongolense]|uniref:type IV secretion system protein n=1 Tax=Rhizobium mongolense TaxID=57676 RepID=UPI0034A193A9
MARKVYEFAMQLFNSYESGWLPNVTGAVVVFIVLVFGLLPMLLILTGVTLFAKMITAVMLAIGPIAILCYFFGITRFVFDAWVRGIASGMFMLLFTYIMAGLSFGFLIGMMDTINGDMATKENALAIVPAMVLYLALISDFARTFAYGAAFSGVPGGGGVDTAYNTARRRLAASNSRVGQAAAVALNFGTDVDLTAVTRPLHPQGVRFIVKEGVRLVYISSLDELRHRLNLDETREAGVAAEDLRKNDGEPEMDKRMRARACPQKEHGEGTRATVMPAADFDLDIDQEKLDRNVYLGSSASRRHQSQRSSTPQGRTGNRPTAAPVLQRQEVREAFGDLQALNEAFFQRSAQISVEPAELNADVELLIGTLSDRMSEESSKAFLREFAEMARDPLGEDRQQ